MTARAQRTLRVMRLLLPTVLLLAQLVQAAKPTLAVVDLEARNMATPDAQLLSDRLRHELVRTGQYTIVERGEMDAVLKEQGFQQSGCTTQECVVEIGQLLNARFMVAGSVGKLGSMFILTARVVDVQSAQVVKVAEATVEGAIEELVKTGIPSVARQLAGKGDVAEKEQGPSLPRPPVPAPKGMVWVPPGKFMMGTANVKLLVRKSPLHEVYVDGFFMDAHEVTQERYHKVMGNNPSRNKGCPKCPVVNVVWSQAKEYCRRVGKRLPTEAEWEKACKAGAKSDFPWGSNVDMLPDYAWFVENAAVSILGFRASKGGRPVGQKKPNAYGLYDMLGNVTEYAADYFDRNYYKVSPARNPTGPATGTLRVCRGGWFKSDKDHTNCVYRSFGSNKTATNAVGFRCAKSVN